MKILQNIVLSAALATSMVAFSTSSMAAEKKEVESVQSILDRTIEHVNGAIASVDNKDLALSHIKSARQAQKDITVGALDQKRQKASAKLVNAGRDINDGKTKEAKIALEEALAAFKELADLSK